jgi:hypothetical protein
MIATDQMKESVMRNGMQKTEYRELTEGELDSVAGGFFAEFFKMIGGCLKNTSVADNPQVIGTCYKDDNSTVIY